MDTQDNVIVKAKADLEQEIEDQMEEVDTKIKNAVTDMDEFKTTMQKQIDDTLKADLALVKSSTSKLVNGFMGFNPATAGADCAAILAARSTQKDGTQWIMSQITKTLAIEVWCQKDSSGKFLSLGGDGSSKENAAGGCSTNPLISANPVSKKWIFPDGKVDGTKSPVQYQCEHNLMLKLCTSDSNVAEWKSDFWTKGGTLNADQAGDDKWATATEDIKTEAYSTKIGAEIEIVAMIKGNKIGRAVYAIHKEFQDKSLNFLINNGGVNMVIGKRVASKSSTNKPLYTRYMKRGGSTSFDMFIDTAGDLMVKQRNYGGSHNSWTRLSTTDRSVTSGCHRYSGIGGEHDCSGWRVQFEAAPITSYCNPTNQYGSNYKNTKGGVAPIINCGGARRTNIDFAILKNPK
jgi:hypothetical protein